MNEVGYTKNTANVTVTTTKVAAWLKVDEATAPDGVIVGSFAASSPIEKLPKGIAITGSVIGSVTASVAKISLVLSAAAALWTTASSGGALLAPTLAVFASDKFISLVSKGTDISVSPIDMLITLFSKGTDISVMPIDMDMSKDTDIAAVPNDMLISLVPKGIDIISVMPIDMDMSKSTVVDSHQRRSFAPVKNVDISSNVPPDPKKTLSPFNTQPFVGKLPPA